jgi:hypothetical protein
MNRWSNVPAAGIRLLLVTTRNSSVFNVISPLYVTGKCICVVACEVPWHYSFYSTVCEDNIRYVSSITSAGKAKVNVAIGDLDASVTKTLSTCWVWFLAWPEVHTARSRPALGTRSHLFKGQQSLLHQCNLLAAYRHEYACVSALTNNLARSTVYSSTNRLQLFLLPMSNDEGELMEIGFQTRRSTTVNRAWSFISAHCCIRLYIFYRRNVNCKIYISFKWNENVFSYCTFYCPVDTSEQVSSEV